MTDVKKYLEKLSPTEITGLESKLNAGAYYVHIFRVFRMTSKTYICPCEDKYNDVEERIEYIRQEIYY